MSEDIAVGLDFGLTNSRVAIYRNGKAEMVPNSQGTHSIASCIEFDKTGVPQIKLSQVMDNSGQTVFDLKKMIGLDFKDPEIQESIKKWPFKLINCQSEVIIETGLENPINYTLDKIISFIFKEMKRMAEEFTGKVVEKCVIAIPPYFDDKQKEILKKASIGSFDVLEFINEPSAIAYAYGFGKSENCQQNLLVFDFGRSTLDMAILRISNKNITVMDFSHHQIGGDDFDTKIIDYCFADFNRTSGINIKNEYNASNRIIQAWRQAKIILSTENTTNIGIDYIYGNHDINITISRECFEVLNFEIFNQITQCVRDFLVKNKMTSEDVSHVLLAGGSSNIPKVQACLQQVLPKSELKMADSKEEMLAFGAADKANEIIEEMLLEAKNELNDYYEKSKRKFKLLKEDIEMISRKFDCVLKEVGKSKGSTASVISKTKELKDEYAKFKRYIRNHL